MSRLAMFIKQSGRIGDIASGGNKISYKQKLEQKINLKQHDHKGEIKSLKQNREQKSAGKSLATEYLVY